MMWIVERVIDYRINVSVELDQVIQLYRDSTLGERRPVNNREVMRAMMDNTPLIVTAWDENQLVGISRTLTDFAYIAYLADLAVSLDHQHQGIGKRLIEVTESKLEPDCILTLLAAPAADNYYEKVGFERHTRAWVKMPKHH